MDIFQHRYYRLGKILMLLSGTWPYQSISARRGILVVVILFTAYQVTAQILAVIKYGEDWNILLKCFVPNVFDAVCTTKYLGFICNSQKMLKLLNRIRSDWEVWARHQEVKILHQYAERGEKITIVYAVTLYFFTIGFMIQPMITKLTEAVLKNSTEPGRFPFPIVYYHLDVQKNYYCLIVYSTLCAVVILTPFVSSEIMLIIYVQHVCSIFAAVGHKLELISGNDTSAKIEGATYTLGKTDKIYLASCIDRHNDAIEYSNLVKASYAWNIFFTVAFGMILFNASGLQMLLNTSDLGATMGFMLLSLSSVMCFFLECNISQILIDHSLSIRFYINNSQWYRLPPKSQKILQLMTMSCNEPCHLTAGNMFIMSAKNFGLAMRTTMSYFAFMRSVQGI